MFDFKYNQNLLQRFCSISRTNFKNLAQFEEEISNFGSNIRLNANELFEQKYIFARVRTFDVFFGGIEERERGLRLERKR